MMKRLLLFLLMTYTLTMAALAEEVTVTGQAPGAVAVGDRFRVEFTVNATSSDIRCDIEGHGFDVLYGPAKSSSYRSEYVGGKMTSTTATTFTYTLSATKEGTFTIPAATVKVNGNTYTSNSITVKVLPADTQADQQRSSSSRQSAAAGIDTKSLKNDVHLHLDLSKTTVTEGEAVVATLKLYFRNHSVASVGEAKLPDFEGFTVQDMEIQDQQATLERYRDANYQMYPLKRWVLFPSRSGDVTIKESALKAVVQVVTRRRSGGFFDFPMDYTQNIDVPLVSGERVVHVKPLPAGKPASFMGGVGDFQVKAEVTSDKVKSGDAFIYRITVSGTGNLKYVRDPEPKFPADFEVYDPKVDLNARVTSAGMSGKKVIEYTVIPRFAGTFGIEPLEFGYYDAKAGQYRTLLTDGFTIEVERGAEEGNAGGGGVADFSGNAQERLKVLGSDIRYLHNVDVSALRREVPRFFGTAGFWMFYWVPVLLFVLLAVIYRRRLKLSADLGRKRTRGASKAATRRLKEAAAALKAKDGAAFYEAVHKAMLGYVADKLNLQLTDLSSDNLRQLLQQHGADDVLVERYADILSTCEFARYAPSGDSQAMDKLYADAVDTLEKLEDSVKNIK